MGKLRIRAWGERKRMKLSRMKFGESDKRKRAGLDT